MKRAERLLERCVEVTARLCAAAEAGEVDALAALLEERAEALAQLQKNSGGALDTALLARVRRGESEALAALAAQRAIVCRELEDLRSARPAVARSQRERAPQLLSRRV